MSNASEALEHGIVPEWTLGDRLRRALDHAGISSQEMADELGVTAGTISAWVNDRGKPPRAAFVRLWALRTGVSPEWLQDGPPREQAG